MVSRPDRATAKRPTSFDCDKLKSRTKRFGFYPDTSQLRPGDIVLLRAIDLADEQDRLIYDYQAKRGLSDPQARFIHAGLYAGEDMLWDCTMNEGVQKRSLSDYVGSRYELMFIRDAGLSEAEQRGWVDRVQVMKDKLWFATMTEQQRRFALQTGARLADSPEQGTTCTRLIFDPWGELTLGQSRPQINDDINNPLLPGEVSGLPALSAAEQGGVARFVEIEPDWFNIQDDCPPGASAPSS